MSIGDAIGGVVGAVGSIFGGGEEERAAAEAGDAQAHAAMEATKEQRRQFDAMQELLAPYVASGEPALQQLAGMAEIGPQAVGQQAALAGLSGHEAQQEAIANIEQSPLYQAQVQQGEQALLQQASATGGLRGGNIQGALAQFRPQMLTQAIENQYAKLGGLTNLGTATAQNLAGIGQASAAGQGAAGMQMASSIGRNLQQAGLANAQTALAQGQTKAGLIGNITGAIGKGIGGVESSFLDQNIGGLF